MQKCGQCQDARGGAGEAIHHHTLGEVACQKLAKDFN